MKKRLLFLRTAVLNLLFIGVLFLVGNRGNAQVTLGASPYQQSFNTTTLPTGWTVRTGASLATSLGTTQTPAATDTWANTSGNFRFVASAKAPLTAASNATAQNGAADRALAVRPSGSFADTGNAFVLQLTNTTGLSDFDLAFSAQLLDPQTRTLTYRVDYGLGAAPTSFTAVGSTFTDKTITGNVWGATTLNFDFGAALDNQSQNVWIRIVQIGASTGTGSRPTIGFDDISLTFAQAATPNLLVSTASLTFGDQNLATQSASQSFDLSGSNLTGFPANITINAPNSNFEVSNDDATWGASTTVAYTSATLASTPVYVRFAPQSAGAQSGDITMSGGGDTTTPTVALSGNGVLAAPVTTAPTNIGQNQFDANWNSVSGATGYLLDVSASATFGTSAVAFSESFTSVTFPPTGWIQTSWARSTTAGDYNTAPAASVGNANSGSLTTSAVANPLSMTFYLGRSGNTTAKTLTVEVSTTSQTSGFTTVATYDHSNVPVSSYNQYTVNLSAYASFPTVYIRFVKTSTTTSPWRLDDIEVTQSVPSFVSGYNALPVTGNTHTVTGLSAYTNYYYRLRATDGAETSANSNVQAVLTLPETITWDGTAWSNTVGPDATKEAEILGVYNTVPNGEFTALKLTITSGSLTIADGTSVTVVNEVENALTAADFVIENNASLIQINDTANTGAATVNRSSAAIMRLDYTLWSSPVSGQTLLGFSPLTVPTRFYTYNPVTDQYNTVASPSTTSFADATGYLIRMPDNHPTTPTVWDGAFTGTPHNGSYVLTVGNNTYNAVGNPYPSVIDADAFINDNGITEALYFWRKSNSAATTSYATYTLAGGVGTGSNSGDPLGLVPNGFIQTGQGFIARSTSTAITFNNDMRVYNYDNQFLRTNTAERHRIWVNLTNAEGLFSQTMIAYMEGASQGIDAAIDGRYFNDSQNALTSIVDNEEFSVQGRSLPFATSDIVPLGFKTETAGNFTIDLDHVDGLFAEGQEVYLRDNLTATVHDFADGAYTFASEAGVFNSRFEIVYDSALAVENPEIGQQGIVAYKQNGQLVINSGNAEMETVNVFDLSGRLLLAKSGIDASEVTIAPSTSNQMLLLHITTAQGETFIKKVLY